MKDKIARTGSAARSCPLRQRTRIVTELSQSSILQQHDALWGVRFPIIGLNRRKAGTTQSGDSRGPTAASTQVTDRGPAERTERGEEESPLSASVDGQE